MESPLYKDDNYNAELKNNDQFTGYNFNTGFFFLWYATDYTHAKKPGNIDVFVWSHSLVFKYLILTYAQRTEYSDRLAYNIKRDEFIQMRRKNDEFYGVQFSLGEHVTFGVFKNYYLYKELSYTFGLNF